VDARRHERLTNCRWSLAGHWSCNAMLHQLWTKHHRGGAHVSVCKQRSVLARLWTACLRVEVSRARPHGRPAIGCCAVQQVILLATQTPRPSSVLTHHQSWFDANKRIWLPILSSPRPATLALLFPCWDLPLVPLTRRGALVVVLRRSIHRVPPTTDRQRPRCESIEPQINGRTVSYVDHALHTDHQRGCSACGALGEARGRRSALSRGKC